VVKFKRKNASTATVTPEVLHFSVSSVRMSSLLWEGTNQDTSWVHTVGNVAIIITLLFVFYLVWFVNQFYTKMLFISSIQKGQLGSHVKLASL